MGVSKIGLRSLEGGLKGDRFKMAKKSGQDKGEGAADRIKGRAKEAFGSATGNEAKKSEGRADQDKGNLKKKKGQFKDLLN